MEMGDALWPWTGGVCDLVDDAEAGRGLVAADDTRLSGLDEIPVSMLGRSSK